MTMFEKDDNQLKFNPTNEDTSSLKHFERTESISSIK